MELTEYQQLYIKAVYEHFQENIEWPTYRQVEKKILPSHHDFKVLDVAESLLDRQSKPNFSHNPRDKAMLTIEQIRQYCDSEKVLTDLLSFVRYSTDKYIKSSEDEVIVESEEIADHLHLDQDGIRKLGVLFTLVPNSIGTMSNATDYTTWKFTIPSPILDFQEVVSVDGLFEKINERKKNAELHRKSLSSGSTIIQYDGLGTAIEKIPQTEQLSANYYQVTVGGAMQLQEQKRKFVQTIYDYFRENAKWPTYVQLDQIFVDEDEGLDVADISKEMADGYANLFVYSQPWEEPATLSLRAIRECKNSEEDLDNFLRSIRLFADMQKKKVGANDFSITGADVRRELNLPETSVEKVGILIHGEGGGLYNGEGRHIEGRTSTWQFFITRAIRKFRGVESINDYLERRDNPGSRYIQLSDQIKQLLGYMYRKPGSEDIETGTKIWIKNLTEPNTETKTGTKLEIALLNALTRLGIPVLFGGDIERIVLATGEKQHSGPQTPVFDLVALNYGSPMSVPTAVLISCKSTTNQPSDIDIRLLSNESTKVRGVLEGWQVFGALVNLGEPTADDYQYRDDIRLWKQSDLQIILNARDHKYIAQFLWTPPWQWKQAIDIMWRNMYKAHHNDLLQEK
jgi:hypothetical protein